MTPESLILVKKQHTHTHTTLPPKIGIQVADPGQLGSGPLAERSLDPRREGTGMESRRRRAEVKTRKAQSDWVVEPEVEGNSHGFFYVARVAGNQQQQTGNMS